MKNFLAVDTSNNHLAVLAVKNGEAHTVFIPDCAMKHSVSVMPAVEEALNKADMRLEECDFFSAVVGAGSFTGIRIGISAIKGMCLAYSKPSLPITSFDIVAYNAIDRKILCLVDALHDCYYVCGYQDGKVVLPPAYLMREQVEELSDYHFVAIAHVENMQVEVVCVAEGLVKAIESKLDCVNQDVDSLVPLYVRKSQAEEGR